MTPTLIVTSTVVTSAPDQSSMLHDIMRIAASSLQATYASINPNVPRFPDYVDPETGAWNAEVITENGAAGLLAGALPCVTHMPPCVLLLYVFQQRPGRSKGSSTPHCSKRLSCHLCNLLFSVQPFAACVHSRYPSHYPASCHECICRFCADPFLSHLSPTLSFPQFCANHP